VPGIEQLYSLLRKYKFTDIELKILDRTKPKGNRAAAKAFAAKVDAALSGFQDADVILVALTVNHKR
jgi:hypothetical protein